MAADSTGAILLLNGLVQGDDVSERIGRYVHMLEIEYSFQSSVTTGTGTDQSHRYLIVYDKQPNGSALTITDVLVSASTVANHNLNNEKRFKILVDEVFALNASAEPGSFRMSGRRHVKLNLPVVFNNGSAGTVADITTGSLYLINIGNNVAGVTAGSLAGRTRVRYLDH